MSEPTTHEVRRVPISRIAVGAVLTLGSLGLLATFYFDPSMRNGINAGLVVLLSIHSWFYLGKVTRPATHWNRRLDGIFVPGAALSLIAAGFFVQGVQNGSVKHCILFGSAFAVLLGFTIWYICRPLGQQTSVAGGAGSEGPVTPPPAH